MRRITANLFAILTALLLTAVLLPARATAQNYPGYGNIWVNDQAEVLSAGAERRIAAELQKLSGETGVQATVLTLDSRAGYSGDSLEAFATGLFNDWGIGDATRNDGILVLVLTVDREIRIELGSGYPEGYDAVARQIVEEVFVPLFGVDAFELGIEAGTVAVIDRIAREHAAGNPPAPVSGGDGEVPADTALAGVLAALFAGFAGWMAFGRRRRNRIRHCPSCGKRGIRTTRETLERATRISAGRVRRTLSCPHCGHRDSRIFKLAATRASGSSGRSFGGGSSSGGGASGRW